MRKEENKLDSSCSQMLKSSCVYLFFGQIIKKIFKDLLYNFLLLLFFFLFLLSFSSLLLLLLFPSLLPLPPLLFLLPSPLLLLSSSLVAQDLRISITVFFFLSFTSLKSNQGKSIQ